MSEQGLSRLSKRCLFVLGLIILLWDCRVGSIDCLGGDFDSQVRQFMLDEMLTQEEIANLSRVFQDLQDTLQTRWPGSTVIPLGSFVTGLASKTSDPDCMVTVPRYHVSSDRHLVREAAHLLRQHPQLYDHIRAKVHKNRRIPLLKFNYKPTQRNCDVNFISNLGLMNSRMMGYYFSLEDKFLSLAAILKFWSKVHHLRSTEALASNTLNLLIIFYLQQIKLAPPFMFLQKSLTKRSSNTWQTDFNKISYNSTNKMSLYELLGGFFKYYSEFNFDEYVVSPLIGRPIPKAQFEDIDSLPDEFSLYKNYVRQPNSKPLAFSLKMCVQDVIEQRRNTADVTEAKANYFISHVKFAAKMYEILPRDLFLRVILDKYIYELSDKSNLYCNKSNK